ncbi:DUF1449 domain-containing protein [Cronbergia sp. UHCC 0137]|uniref:DUF1449 domain-containing protein n=1 Tax=Cronbergia sp. UHCC 0137 TaxID=3110239 RepID=UPI002B2022D8|nr:DUF1449 domain-containing protein [Cronbergia sp. UHCC 0137]MEA5618255.1 DUF1449 domain-containing protein [Cronbergia sp. UHCC 0137]
MLFSSVNLPYWIFLGTGVLLFLFMIVAGGGEEDLDSDADLDVELNSEFSFDQLLGWVGLGKAPLILLLAIDLSLWGVIGWMLNVWLGGLFQAKINALMGIIVLLTSLIISLFGGRLLAQPIGKIFAEFSEDVSSDRLIGGVGTVTSFYIPTEHQGKIGQVDILDPKRNLLTITAIIPDWATVAPQRGDKVIVIELKQRIYVVIAKDSVDEERWLDTSNRGI